MINQLDDPSIHLSDKEKRELDYEILQNGLVDGTGDYLYAANPDNTLEDNCDPELTNPRAKQKAYGSLSVDTAGGFADQYQPIGVISEFGGIPGQGTVTHISMHRSTQAAAGNGMHLYKKGDTETYNVDGKSTEYSFVEMIEFDPSRLLPDVIADIKAKYPGKDILAEQVCQPDDNDYATYIFERIEA